MKNPIFVSGLSKSGTSMVKTLFDGQPALFVVPPNELLFFYFSDLSSVNRMKAAEPTSEPSRLPRNLSKSIWEMEYFPELFDWFGDMKFIYVLRNPYAHFRAAVKSIRAGKKGHEGMKPTLRNRFPFIGRQLALMRTSYRLMRKYRKLFGEHFFALVYDRLLEDPDTELKRVCDFLELEFHPTLRCPTILGQPWGGNSWYVDNYDGIDKRPLTHWRGKISQLEIKYVNHHFQDVVEDFGFEVLPAKCSIVRPFHYTENPVD